MQTLSLLCTALILAAACASPAHAYIGFGPGMTMIGSFFSLLAAVFITLAMVIILPVRLLLKRRKAKKQSQETEDSKA